MAKEWAIMFIVTGRTHFPVDMLRYDSCWPRSSEAATEISFSLSDDGCRTFHKIELTHIGHGIEGKMWRPTYKRWESFGWKVEKVGSSFEVG